MAANSIPDGHGNIQMDIRGEEVEALVNLVALTMRIFKTGHSQEWISDEDNARFLELLPKVEKFDPMSLQHFLALTNKVCLFGDRSFKLLEKDYTDFVKLDSELRGFTKQLPFYGQPRLCK